MIGRRRGFTLLEVGAACGLLAVALVVSAQIVARVATARRVTQRETLGLIEATNALERLTAMPWQELTPQRAAEQHISRDVQEALGNAQLVARIDSVPTDPDARWIRVEVRWNDSTGIRPAPIRLTAWRYKAVPPAAHAGGAGP